VEGTHTTKDGVFYTRDSSDGEIEEDEAMTKADRKRARQLLRRKIKEQHSDSGDEMLQNHDESSLMRDMGIMPVP